MNEKIQKVHKKIEMELSKIKQDIIDTSLDLHNKPETAMEEHYAHSILTKWLKNEGFSITTPVADLNTAFVAKKGSGKPVIAFLLEYDALPQIGHACGHNLIATGGLAASTALGRALDNGEFEGTVLAIGTPGEEGAGGKIIELEAGVFDGVDACLMFHPNDQITIPWRHLTANAHLSIKYFGKSAHTASHGEEGKNALSALIQFFVATDMLRQHIPDTSRLNGIITKGGDAPNIIPEYAEAEFLVRALTQEKVKEMVKKVEACAEGTALSTGTKVRIEQNSPVYAEMKNNKMMANRMAGYLEQTGEVVAAPVIKGGAGSSDIGNISLKIPTIHPYLKITPNAVAGHSIEFREAAKSPEAHQAMLNMAEALAKTGADLLLDPEYFKSVQKEFAESGPDYPD
ncbi:amidohydrolase [Virgibacillus dakarensis]|nr:amidohydrolase [Virgibacillus dakarensis]